MIPEPDRSNLCRLAARVWAAVWDFVAAEVELHRPPPTPGKTSTSTPSPFRFRFEPLPRSEGNMAQYRAVAPFPPLPTDPAQLADIDHIEVTLSVDGTAGAPKSFPRDAAEYVADGPFDIGQNLRAEMVYVDAAGNMSVTPAVAEATVSDSTPPADPGTFAFGFEPIAAPPTEPPAENPPAEPPPVA